MPLDFFTMPAPALRSLREELDLSGVDDPGGILHRYGFRCGQGIARELGERRDVSELAVELPLLLLETGLGRPKVISTSAEEVVVDLDEALEAAQGGGGCHFTTGYIAGLLSEIIGREYRGTESSCVSQAPGTTACRFELTVDRGLVQGTIAAIAALGGSPTVPAPGGKEDTRLLPPPPPPRSEVQPISGEGPKLETGVIYAIQEARPDGAMRLFAKLLDQGHAGLCVTRDYPKKVQETYGLKGVPFFWLSSAEDVGAIQPTQLSLLYHEIENFYSREPHAVLMIAGLEYLISQNSFAGVLKFVQLLVEKVALYDQICLIPISPETMESKEWANLQRELRMLDP